MSLKTRKTVAKRFVVKRSKKGIKLIKRENGEAEAHRMVLGDKTVIEF